jgi:dCTP deaminase
MFKEGALSSQEIEDCFERGFVSAAEKRKINPASLDISASVERYRIDSIFLPKHGEKVRDIVMNLGARMQSVDDPLEKGVVYAIKIKEILALPEVLYGFCNPKSSTGRHDLHVRIVVDSTARYDTIPSAYAGEVWAIVTPRSYPVIIPNDFPISQIRFFTKDTRFTESDLFAEWQKAPLAYHLDGKEYGYTSFRMKDGDGSLLLTLDLSQPIVGYEARGTSKVLNMGGKNGSVDPATFFMPLQKTGETLLLKKDSFYILSTKEALRLPPYIASEMVDMDSRTGEFRSHYAGFFDPGWGFGKNGEGKGRPITLEVRPFEDVVIGHGQPIGKVRFEKMSEIPKPHYDEKSSNYLTQSGPKLAKQFS